MKKAWKWLTRADSNREKQAAQAEKSKPGKPIAVNKIIPLEPSTFRANLLDARRKGYFSDIVIETEDKKQFYCHKAILFARTKAFLSRGEFQRSHVRKRGVSSLAMDKFLDLIYFGEIGLMSLKRDRTARAQFLEMAKAELSEIVYQLLKTAASPSTPVTHWHLPMEDLAQDFEKIVGAHDFHDCRVKSDDGSIRAHRVILASRMPMFNDAWLSNWDGVLVAPKTARPKNKDGESSSEGLSMSGEGEENLGFISDRRTSDSLPTFDLSKFPQKFVAEIIRYCYTDVTKFSSDDIPLLFLKQRELIKKEDFMRKVEGYLAENMSKTNLSEILKTSVKFEAKLLARACKAYYDKNKKYMEKIDDSIIPESWIEGTAQHSAEEGSNEALTPRPKKEKQDKEISVDSSSESWQEKTSGDEDQSLEFSLKRNGEASRDSARNEKEESSSSTL